MTHDQSLDWLNHGLGIVDQRDPRRIVLRDGHPGRTVRTMEYLVRGAGQLEFIYDSIKGGRASRSVTLP